MLSTKYDILAAFMVVLVLRGINAMDFKRYEMLTTNQNIDRLSLPLLQEDVPSVIACVIKCEFLPECRYIFFNQNTSECIFHSQRKAMIASFQHWRVTCPRVDYDYQDSSGSCYKEQDKALTWLDARDACAKDGGHLLTFDTSDEYTFEGVSTQMWVGATDSAVEGEFRWLGSGDLLLSSLPWGTNQPDGGAAEQCLKIVVQTTQSSTSSQERTMTASKGSFVTPAPLIAGGNLHDGHCDKQLPYVCEL